MQVVAQARAWPRRQRYRQPLSSAVGPMPQPRQPQTLVAELEKFIYEVGPYKPPRTKKGGLGYRLYMFLRRKKPTEEESRLQAELTDLLDKCKATKHSTIKMRRAIIRKSRSGHAPNPGTAHTRSTTRMYIY